MVRNCLLIIVVFVCIISGCSTENTSSIVGKWYFASKDTKIIRGTGCDLKDTTFIYTPSNTAVIFDFKADKTYITSAGGTSFTSQGTYSFSNNTLIINSVGNPPQTIEVQNLNTEGWRVSQTNYVWCPVKTSFSEFINYKKI